MSQKRDQLRNSGQVATTLDHGGFWDLVVEAISVLSAASASGSAAGSAADSGAEA